MPIIGRNVVPILMLAASVWAYFGFISPKYESIKSLQVKKEQYEQAIADAKEATHLRGKLLSTLSSYSEEEWLRLRKLVPDKVDGVRLAMDVHSLAELFDLELQNFSFEEVQDKIEAPTAPTPAGGEGFFDTTGVDGSVMDASGTAAPTVQHGTMAMEMEFESTYANFMAFMRELEKNLQLLDISEFSVDRGAKSEEEESNAYTFKVTLLTYWLK